MNACARPYPRYYRRLLPKGQLLKKEEVNGLHVRLYLLDPHRRLRLIFINDGSLDRQYVLTTLDDRCTWPAALYPDGPPRHPSPQQKLPGLADLPLHARADAWI